MEIVDPREFVPGNLFKETEFRERVAQFDWSKYQGKPVLIQGCGSVILPTWTFMVITAALVPVAKSIHYGETARPIQILGKLGGQASPPNPSRNDAGPRALKENV